MFWRTISLQYRPDVRCAQSGALGVLLLAAVIAVGGGVAQADHIDGHATPCNLSASVGGGQPGLSPGPTGPPDSAHLGWDVGSGQCNGSFTVTDDASFAGGHIELGLRAEQRSVGQVADNGGGDYTVQLGSDTTQPNANRAWWNFQPSIAYSGNINDLDALTLTIVTDRGSAIPPSPTTDLLALRGAIDDRHANTTPTSGFTDLYQISQNSLFGWLNACTTNADCTVGTCTHPFSVGLCLSEEGAWKFTLAATEGADTAQATICIHTPGTSCCGPRFVETTGSDASNFCNDSGAPCATIQHAVDVACDGDTVNVAAGTYTEQVLVKAKSVNLVGAGKASTFIAAPPKASRAFESADHGFGVRDYDYLVGVFGTGSETVDISGFTLDGLNDAAISGGGNPFRSQQLTFLNANGTIADNSLIDWQDPSSFGAQGVASLVVGSLTPVTVDILSNMVSGYQKGAIVAFGSGALVATIDGNMTVGAGPITSTAQNGIQMSNGATGSIANNDVRDNNFTPATVCSAGILVFGVDGILVQGNFMSGSLCDLLAITNGSTIDDNQIPAALDFPFSILGSGNTANGNVVNGSPFDGIYVDGINNTFSCNRVTNNGGAGFFFDSTNGFGSTAGTPNTVNMNSIFGNGTGVDASLVIGPPDIDAEDNWWGAADGPSGVGPGSGDAVTVNVDSDPFATAVPACVNCTADAQCNDGLACTGTETCNLGTNMCQSGAPVVCVDQCETCIEPAGTCEPKPDGTDCNTGQDICTDPDSCQLGSCVNDGGGGDTDGDTICDADDNCPADPNTTQANLDIDGLGDVCDPNDGSLNVTLVRLRQQPNVGNGTVNIKGDFLTEPPADIFTANNPSITLRVEDSLNLAQTRTWPPLPCLVNSSGRVKCTSPDGLSKAQFRPFPKQPSVFRFRAKFKKLALNGPFAGPVTVTLTYNGAIDRVGTISDCAATSSGLKCREF